MRSRSSSRLRYMTAAGILAALYVVLTGISALFGLDKGAVQLRLSEMLTVLPMLTPAAVPGLFVGCFLGSMLCGAIPTDAVLGSTVTLLAALLTRAVGRRSRVLGLLPPILLNALYVPLIVRYGYGAGGMFLYHFLTVLAGETVTAGVCGSLLLRYLPEKLKKESWSR